MLIFSYQSLYVVYMHDTLMTLNVLSKHRTSKKCKNFLNILKHQKCFKTHSIKA